MTSSRPPDPAAEAPPADLAAGAAMEGVATVPAHRPLTVRHYLWLGGVALFLAAALHWLGPVLTPFLIGGILAYLGTPLVSWLHRRGMPRTLGTLIVIALFGIVIAMLALILVPLVQAEILLAFRRLPDFAGRLVDLVAPWAEEMLGLRIALDLETLKGALHSNLDSVRAVGLRVLSSVRTGGAILLSILVNLALIPVVMFYILRDWNMLLARVDALIPHRWRRPSRDVMREVDLVLSEFLHGQVMVMVVLAAYYATALWVAGLDKAIAIGVLTGLLVFIPYVGFGLGLTLGVLAALLQWNGLGGFLAVLAVYGVGQLLENYVLIPYLVGDRIGLHPLAVIFALMAFGQLFGFAGVLLALPLAAVLLVGLRHLRNLYAHSLLYQD